VGSREVDIAPDRGAQGDALKTLLAMPFALGGNAGQVVTFPPSRTIPSMDAQGRLVDQPFESRSLRQSAPPEISLRRIGRQKNAWFQKGLAERPETTLPARRPISFSFQPVSPRGRDLANLVTARVSFHINGLADGMFGLSSKVRVVGGGNWARKMPAPRPRYRWLRRCRSCRSLPGPATHHPRAVYAMHLACPQDIKLQNEVFFPCSALSLAT
jgi:hypothetical protein